MPVWLLFTTVAGYTLFSIAGALLSLWITIRVVRRAQRPRRLLAIWLMLVTISLIDSVAMMSARGSTGSPMLPGLIAVAGMALWALVLKLGLRAGIGRAILATLLFAVLHSGITYGVVWPARKVLIEAFYLSTSSMAPTLAAGDRFLVDHTAHPKRWDIVVFHPPGEPQSTWAKRLVGLPGETLEIVGGEVQIDGTVLPKPSWLAWLKYQTPTGYPQPARAREGHPFTLGANEVFVLGDNTAQSLDSRYWTGTLQTTDLLGVVRVIYSPLSRARILDEP